MEKCLDSPLNKAHYFERKGLKEAKKYNFDDAVLHHLKASELLLEALNLTENPKARESIELQHQYHKKQAQLLKLKKKQYEALKEALKVQKEAMSRALKAKTHPDKSDGAALEKAINRTFEEADSLLEILINRDKSLVPLETVSPNSEGAAVGGGGSKKPKPECTVIEELRIVNYQLRSLIKDLMSQLVDKEAEVTTLRKRVAELEEENVSKKCSTPDHLPALAPLELPNFDLSVLHKKYQAAEEL